MKNAIFKLFLLSAVALFLVLARHSLQAQEVAVHGSYFNADGEENSFGAGGYFGLPVMGESPAVSLNWDARLSYLSGVIGDVGMIPLETGLSVSFLKNAPLSAYGGGGIGYYIFDSGSYNLDDSLGWYLVAGGRMELALKTYLRGELIYRDTTETARSGWGRNYKNVDMRGLGINLGIGFDF